MSAEEIRVAAHDPKTGGDINVTLDAYPDTCPTCRHAGQPKFLTASYVNHRGWGDEEVHCIFQCPRHKCLALYIGRYRYKPEDRNSIDRRIKLHATFPQLFVPPLVPALVSAVSARFIEIYSQASEAESLRLPDVAGPGYRKALEHLIKDFAISQHLAQAEDIQKMSLQGVIDKYVADSNIKDCAERAWWLGNDESHYLRKWDLDLKNLVEVIQLTINWIDNHERTKVLKLSMPEGKK